MDNNQTPTLAVQTPTLVVQTPAPASTSTTQTPDDNEEILAIIKKMLDSRLQFGRKKYGHGVIVNEDTQKYGTEADSWEMMHLEEALDGMIYSAAAMIRVLRKKNMLSNK